MAAYGAVGDDYSADCRRSAHHLDSKSSTKLKKKLLILLALSLIVIGPTAVAFHFYTELPLEPLPVGTALPEFTVEPIGHEQPVPQSGRMVLLLFNPSCGSCEEFFAQLETLRLRHPEWFFGEKAMNWVPVSISDRRESEQYSQRTTWPIYFDPKNELKEKLRYIGTPYLVLVDEHRRIQYRHNGLRSLEENETLFRKLFEESQ